VGGRVTAIERGPGGAPLTVYVDGEPAFTVSPAVAERLGIRVGMEWAVADPHDEAAPRAPARESALRLLAVRARTRSELLDRLRRKGVDEETARRVVEELAEVGLVDDEAFARLWADERIRTKPVGAIRLRAELAAKGVRREIVEAVVRETYERHSEDELVRRVLERRARGRQLVGRERGRALAFLLRRGFSRDVSTAAIREREEESE
jgi:regulatory protein